MTLALTKQIKAIIQSAGFDERLLTGYFNDKKKDGRRYKFYHINPTIQQILDIDKLLKSAGINATADINICTLPYRSYFSTNKLIINVNN